MKKSILLIITCLFISLLSFSNVSGIFSRECDLTINLVNQDPNPVSPGEEVKVLFQLIGTEIRDCGDLAFKIFEDFPFTVHPKYSSRQVIKAGTFTHDYQSFFTLPYTLRIDKDSSEGEIELKIGISQFPNRDSYIIKKFNITIKEVQTDFEVYVRDYISSENRFTLEILNIGKNDIEALTIEIPKQEKITVKGSNKNIIGFLDSTDFTTTSFEAIPQEGEIELIIHYTDIIGERRSINKTVLFEPEYFSNRIRDKKTTPVWVSVVIFFVLVFILHTLYKKHKKKKKKKLLENNN